MAERRTPASDFTYSPVARRYREAATGKFVPEGRVNDALDAVLDAQATALRTATERLQAGDLTLSQWQVQMEQGIKTAQLSGTAIGRGGWAQLSQADLGWAGRRIREQYAYLRDFAGQVASGAQPLDGTALARAAMYGQAGRMTEREMGRRLAGHAGQRYERRILGPADHCPDCVDAAARGWQPLGTLPPIGESACLTNCHCTFEFSATDPEAAQEAA